MWGRGRKGEVATGYEREGRASLLMGREREREREGETCRAWSTADIRTRGCVAMEGMLDRGREADLLASMRDAGAGAPRIYRLRC